MRSVFSLLLILVGACAPEVRFVRADAAYREHLAARAPEVFVDKAPSMSYRSIGMIEVVVDDNTATQEVVAAAAAKGREVGCELLVEKSLAARQSRRGGFVLVHEFDSVDRTSTPQASQRTWSFVCGVVTAAPVVPTLAT